MYQLYAAIWRVSAKRQIALIILAVLIAALAAAPLKFQQDIINLLSASGASHAELLKLGAGMIAVILLSLGLKWLNGYLASLLGEDVIRTIRGRLVTAVVTEGAGHRPIYGGTLSTAVSAEAEDLGKFAGSAYSDPVMQVGTLISVIGFVAATQPGLGLLAVGIIAPQVIIVLLTQNEVNRLVGERVRVLRATTDKIATDDLSALQAGILEDFDRIYGVRRRMFQWKLSTKFILSAINGAGTVAVLMLGGWFVINGETDVGTVVAATLGLSRLQGPTTFLIAFYRQVSANRVKYDLLRGLVVEGR